ncbi:hypothetical protein EVA_08942 [gut metagenome]|uniref:Uncharacterized protein n=1 Tax=gut metagenome TaxID=749906 RepID=J9GLA5_9ZZZZ
MFLSYSDAAVKAFTAKKRRGIPVRFFAFLENFWECGISYLSMPIRSASL